MTAMIISVEQEEAPEIYIKIALNDANIIPVEIIEGFSEQFRIWKYHNNNYIFIWQPNTKQKLSMLIPQFYINYIISSKLANNPGDYFSIMAPCRIIVNIPVQKGSDYIL